MTRKRNAGRRSIRPVMRIFTEGEKTEINYVRGYISSYLKSKGYTAHDIIIEQPNDSSPLGLLNAARQTRLPMDEMWIVFDCDRHQHKPETFKGAAEEGIGVAYSSISFETWILLHFTYSTRSYRSCDELMKVLDRHYSNGYNKAMNNLFEETAGADHSRLLTAIAQPTTTPVNPLDETLASIAAMREQLTNLENRLLEAGRKIKAALVEQRLKERQYADAPRKLERIRLAV